MMRSVVHLRFISWQHRTNDGEENAGFQLLQLFLLFVFVRVPLRTAPKLTHPMQHAMQVKCKLKLTKTLNCGCDGAWFGPAPHVRGAHAHAVPAVVRLSSHPRCEVSAPPLDPARKKTVIESPFETGLCFLPGPRGGAHLAAGLWGQANNRWHGTGMGAPDVRCGAKPCPVTATVEHFGTCV